VMANIGIRHRGTGSRSGVKPYFGLKFDQYVKGQRFVGLASLRIKNSIQDASFLHERLSMQLLRQMGVPAPREAFVRMTVNGEYIGLFAAIEEIDSLFLDRVFGEHNGCLYNYNWIDEYRFEYLGADPALYSPDRFEPKSCDAATDPAYLIDMIRDVNQAGEADFPATVSQYLNVKLFLLHLAAENYLSEGDSIVGYAGMNNFYLYRLAGTKQFRLIAWDKDITLDDISHSIWYNIDTNVLTRRLLATDAGRRIYLQALQRTALEAGGSGGWMEQELNRAYQQIRDSAYADPSKPFSNQEFEAAVLRVRSFVQNRTTSVLSQTGPWDGPTLSGVGNGASFVAGRLAAGSIASIFGDNLAYTVMRAWTLPLPRTLDHTRVQVNGVDAPLFYVSPEQINFQMPWEVAAQPTVSITVLVDSATKSLGSLTLTATAPGIFSTAASGAGQGAILIAGTDLLAAPAGSTTGPARPAARGEHISIFCTGLGAVSNPGVSGNVPSGGLSLTALTPEVTIGGIPAQIQFSGLAPGLVGVYQVNALVPAQATPGEAVPVRVSMGGLLSNQVTIAVQ
jgi:uncharacterized protein (TIGR03437 family)